MPCRPPSPRRSRAPPPAGDPGRRAGHRARAARPGRLGRPLVGPGPARCAGRRSGPCTRRTSQRARRSRRRRATRRRTPGSRRSGSTQAETTELLRRSVRLADQARAAGRRGRRGRRTPTSATGWVAASVGPYGAMLADGSEYRGDYGLSVEAAAGLPPAPAPGPGPGRASTCPTARACWPSRPSRRWPRSRRWPPSWPGWACRPGSASRRTATGCAPASRSLEAFRIAAAVPEVVAVGVNCCEPSDVDQALAIAAAADLGVPVIAYPNTGEVWDAAARAWTGEPTLDAERAQAWTHEGARALGGCCRVGPALLSRLATAVELSSRLTSADQLRPDQLRPGAGQPGLGHGVRVLLVQHDLRDQRRPGSPCRAWPRRR